MIWKLEACRGDERIWRSRATPLFPTKQQHLRTRGHTNMATAATWQNLAFRLGTANGDRLGFHAVRDLSRSLRIGRGRPSIRKSFHANL
jgi:hypothetical protein